MEFVYILKLIPRLINENNWSKEEHDIVSNHYQNLVTLQSEGTLLLAGKTAGQDEDTMGIVIFKADSFEEATAVMKNDPAIKNGIMTGTLWEYNLALFNKDYSKK